MQKELINHLNSKLVKLNIRVNYVIHRFNKYFFGISSVYYYSSTCDVWSPLNQAMHFWTKQVACYDREGHLHTCSGAT